MSYLTIRLPESQIKRLKQLAASRRVSMSALFEEFSATLLAERDAKAIAAEIASNEAEDEHPVVDEAS